MAAMLVVTASSPALAHESREVGPYTFTVGWENEPAYSGLPNAVSLRIRDTASEEPFVDLGDGLAVDVIYGEEMTTVSLRPAFGDPGHYRSDLVPSRPGTWAFRFHGTVGDLEVDELFTSGPETFNDIQDVALASWPVQDPSTAELAERMERELARVDERVSSVEAMDTGSGTATGDDTADAGDDMADDEEMADLETRLAALETGGATDSDGGSSSTTPAIVLGIVALLLAAAALGVSLVSRKT